MRSLGLAAGAVIAASTLSACGSGSDFSSQANRVCTDGHAKLVAAAPIPGDAGLRAQADAYEFMASGLGALKPPAARAAALGRLIREFRAAGAAERAAAGTGDADRLRIQLAQEQLAFVGVRADGKAVGADTCAQQVLAEKSSG